MSDTPKFEVIDRRKMKAAEEEQEGHTAAPAAEPEEMKAAAPAAGPRLVVNEAKPAAAAPEPLASQTPEEDLGIDLPPLPAPEEIRAQKEAFVTASERLDELIRAQNPTVGPQPAVTFPHLVQQFYLTAMIQMGAGGQEGQRPRVDILGAKGTIDLLNVLEEKTRGNLSAAEDRMLQTVLHEVRTAFNELVSMIQMQAVQPPPIPPGKR